jgi:hypothetical protein
VTPERLEAMQAALAKVWHRFTYWSHTAIREELGKVGRVNITNSSNVQRLRGELQNDAFQTIIQWLSGRVKKR